MSSSSRVRPGIEVLFTDKLDLIRGQRIGLVCNQASVLPDLRHAADVFFEHPDIDLTFSDVVMPGGMNGFELAKAAYSIRPDLKVVHTSGYPRGAMVHQEESRFREGFIIMKPYRREDLHNILKEALEVQ